MYFRAPLRRWYNKVTLKLDALTVANYMNEHNSLKPGQLESIQAMDQEPTNAAKKLLNIVIQDQESPGVYTCFLEALQQTGHQHVSHQHVYELIMNGNSTGSYESK